MQRSVSPPSSLRESLGVHPEGRAWLDRLPQLVTEVRQAWDLKPICRYAGGACSWAEAVELPDGRQAALKITWPHREMLGEPEALRIWSGHGAVEVYAHDPDRHALLLERCDPGTKTTDIRAALELLRELHAVQPGPNTLERLDGVWADWAPLAADRMARLKPPYDAKLVAHGISLMRELPGSAQGTVLLHGDYNPGNVLASQRRPWLAIDPKPMLGDPAYDPWPLLEQVDDPTLSMRARFALAADILGEPKDRIIKWAIARRVETALWAAAHDDVAGGGEVMAEAAALADLL